MELGCRVPDSAQPPGKVMNSEARWREQDVISENTKDVVALRSPDAIAVLTPRVSTPDLPSLSLFPSRLDDDDTEDQPTLKRDASVDDSKTEAGQHATQAANAGCSNEHYNCHEGPAPTIPANAESPNAANVQQPDQEAVSKEEPSVPLHSRESVAALTLHMSTPVNSYQAYSLPGSNAELEFRLRWKPPNTKEGSKRHAYHAVSDRMRPSAIKHLPSPGTASPLPITRPSLAYIAQAIAPHSNLELEFRLCPKRPDSEGGRRFSCHVVSERETASTDW
ncbi:hypothetical protein AX14_003633 [Amanita brunnescens Koide BX004]|nr:hypothetical protein AX14_003633 [Amanita brunnescens Koide BX004]